jgi:hypothetical protein
VRNTIRRAIHVQTLNDLGKPEIGLPRSVRLATTSSSSR